MNEKLPFLKEFFEELEFVKSRSPHTIESYKRDLRLFEDFIKEGSKKITLFYKMMSQRGLGLKSQARIISSIRTYVKFCQLKDVFLIDLSELKTVKFSQTIPEVVRFEQFEKMISASKSEIPYKTIRNELVLLFLFGIGCRVSELVQIDLYDFNEVDNLLILKGKGRKERFVPLTSVLRNHISKYISEARDQFNVKNKKALLLNNKGQRPSRVDIWRWLKLWSVKAGFKTPLSPHKFRHGFATSLLESEVDLRSIQTLLGHSSIQTTQIYTSVTTKNVKKIIDKHHLLLQKDSK